MPSTPSRAAVFLMILSLLLVQTPSGLWAQAAPTPQELDQLLAPIALYPDALLAQITTASTNPQEILDVDNWLASNPDLTSQALSDAAQQQGFDPAFIALVQFPTIIQMMAQNIDDYAAIGQAVVANQAEVAASIQRLRAQAYAAGSLRTTPQQTVEVQQASGQTIYVIQPANPKVVYIPQYNPTVVYAAPSTGAVVATSLIAFGIGIGIGALIYDNHPWGWGGWGWNWGGRTIYYNRAVWGGWHGGYRPPYSWYRPRPVPYNARPGYGGNWHYRPPNYRPPAPIYRPGGSRPGPDNRPVYGRPGTRPTHPVVPPGNVYPGRPPGQPNRPGNPGGQPGRPVVQPNRPAPGAPGNKPNQPNPGRPVVQPNRPVGNQPGRPGGQPSRPNPPANKPAPTPSRPPQNRPVTKPGNPPSHGTRPTNTSRPAQQPNHGTPQHKQSKPAAKPSGKPAGNGKPGGNGKPS